MFSTKHARLNAIAQPEQFGLLTFGIPASCVKMKAAACR
jgi:hypothetical protein